MSQNSQLIDLLRPLLGMLESDHTDIRKAGSDLFFELHKQGQIQLSEAIKYMVVMQVDTCPSIRQKALAHLHQVIRTKLKYFTSCFQPSKILKDCHAHYSLIEPKTTFSGFVQTRRDGVGKEDFVVEDKGVFDALISLLANED